MKGIPVTSPQNSHSNYCTITTEQVWKSMCHAIITINLQKHMRSVIEVIFILEHCQISSNFLMWNAPSWYASNLDHERTLSTFQSDNSCKCLLWIILFLSYLEMHLQMTARNFSYSWEPLVHTLPWILSKNQLLNQLDNQNKFAPPHFRHRMSWYLMIMPTGIGEASLAITLLIHLD